MYVCLCHSVTEKHIAKAIAEGANCLKDLQSSLRITTTCGRCTSCAHQCLEESIQSNQTTINDYAIARAV